MRPFLSLIFIFSIFSVSTFPQAAAEKSRQDLEKEQKERENQALKIIDDAIADAGGLKLPRNRAIIYAISGDLLWRFNEKRARELFRNSAAEIIEAIAASEEEELDNNSGIIGEYSFHDGDRTPILLMIAKRDADLALELMLLTRPARTSEAMIKAELKKAKPGNSIADQGSVEIQARFERELERKLTLMATQNNPEKAIKFIKDNLGKGLSKEIISALQIVYSKDEKKALELAAEAVRAFISRDLNKNKDYLQEGLSILKRGGDSNQAKNKDEKKFEFSDSQRKDIANKIASTLLQSSASLGLGALFKLAIPILEKIIPERMILLKQKQSAVERNLPPELREMLANSTSIENSSPEQLIASLPNLEGLQKLRAFRSLKKQIDKIEDEAKARKLIEQIPDERMREEMLNKYEAGKIGRLSNEGNLDEARSIIARISKKRIKIQKLTDLALAFHKKNSEKDIEKSLFLMKDAKSLINELPENRDELDDMMIVVKAYSQIDPGEAFRLFNPIVDELNIFIEGSAIRSKYGNDGSFEKGEFIMELEGSRWDESLLFKYINIIQMLGKSDIAKMSALAERFQRNDARSIVKLFIAKGFLAEKIEEDDDDDEISPLEEFLDSFSSD